VRRAAEFPVVALVSSTGGLDALSRVLTRLSAGFPAAVVALQHLDPEQHSHLPELLAHKTILPVCWAVDGQSVVPGTVVVAPPGRHMLVGGNGEVALVLSGKTPPPRPSADLLLSSLALSMGPRVIAVILTGQGHDGMAGVAAVKRFGGRVLAQDQASAAAFGMPGSAIDTHLVDRVAPIDSIAGLLGVLVATA